MNYCKLMKIDGWLGLRQRQAVDVKCSETAFEQGRSEKIKNDGLPKPRFLERGGEFSAAARLRADTGRLEKEERAARE